MPRTSQPGETTTLSLYNKHSPATAAAGAEKRRKVLNDKTNTPRIMPAPAECSAPQIRGKARSRTNAQSVGAGQRLGLNLEKLSDTAEYFAVEGAVTGELGRQHWAFGVAVGVIGGRVPPGSRGGRVSAEDKKAVAEAPIEMFVLAHDSGMMMMPFICSCRNKK